MLQCDWCHKPIGAEGAEGWAFQVELTPFHSLALDGGHTDQRKPGRIVLEAHLHAEPCKDELGWAIDELLRNREPLETDGPTDEVDQLEERTTEEEPAGDHPTIQELHEAHAHWRRLTKADRQRFALNALGDERLIAREIFERVAATLPKYGIYRSEIDPVLKLLLEAREVERVREQRGARMLWVYSARRELEGPIAELERTFNEPGSKGGDR